MKRKKFTREHIMNLTQSLIGRKWSLSKEARRNIGNAKKGIKQTKIHRKKRGLSISKALTGRVLSELELERNRRVCIGNKSRTGYKNKKSHNKKISLSLLGNQNTKGHKHTAKTKAKLSILHKKLWSNSEYKNKMLKKFINSSQAKPNKKEFHLFNLINKIQPKKYKLNVKGNVILNGRIPDIVNVNGQKKCIELFGDYWHRNDSVRKKKTHYRKLGWDCLVIWERELKNEKKVIKKLQEFC